MALDMKSCSHIYVLPPPNGSASPGVCKLCQHKKMHYNFVQEQTGWRVWASTTPNPRTLNKT